MSGSLGPSSTAAVTLALPGGFKGFLITVSGGAAFTSVPGGTQLFACGTAPTSAGWAHSDNAVKQSSIAQLALPASAGAPVSFNVFVLVSLTGGWYGPLQSSFQVGGPPPAAALSLAGPPAPPQTWWCSPNSVFCVSWAVDPGAGTIRLSMNSSAVPSGGYLGVGFGTAFGTMCPADIYLGWRSTNFPIVDSWCGSGENSVVTDTHQDATGASGSYANGVTSVSFVRPLNTGDVHDRTIIQGGSLNLTWAVGPSDGGGFSPGGHNQNLNVGFGYVTLVLYPFQPPPAPPLPPPLTSPPPLPPPPPSPLFPPLPPSPPPAACVLLGTCPPPPPPLWQSWCSDATASPLFCLGWSYCGADTITLRVRGTTTGAVSVGFTTAAQKMSPADVYVAWVNCATGASAVSDRTSSGYLMPTADATQAATVVSGSCGGSVMEVIFTRPLLNANGVNVAIAAGSGQNIIWSLHDTPPPGLAAHSVAQRGFTSTPLTLVPMPPPPSPPPAACALAGTCSPPPPVPPSPPYPAPPLAAGISAVSFSARFASMSLAALEADAALNASFVSSLLTATASLAGVSIGAVSLTSLTSGSVIARLTVLFPAVAASNATAFSTRLAAPGAAFAAMPAAFGTPTVSGISVVSAPPAPPPPAPLPPAGYSTSWCAAGEAICVVWSLRSGGSKLRFNVTASTSGYVAIGFAGTFARMSPADVYALWVDPATAVPALLHLRNPGGYDAPVTEPSQSFAALVAGATANGVLTACFDLTLGAGAPSDAYLVPGRATNLIWSTAASTPAGPTGSLAQHSSSSRGYAPPLNMFCTDASCTAVLPVPVVSPFTQLHRIALAVFGSVLGFAMLLRSLRLAWPLAESVSQGARLPGQLMVADWLLIAGYTIGMWQFAARALLDAVTPGRALGQLTALHLGLLVLPVTRTSLLCTLLGSSFERAVAWHRRLAPLMLASALAHGGRLVKERGRLILRSLEPAGGVPNGTVPAYGTVSLSLMLLMSAFAMPPVRRRAYEVFKLVHMGCFPTIIALSCLHAAPVFPYLAPGIVLWVFDRAVRLARRLRSFEALATPLPGGSTLLAVHTCHRVAAPPASYFFVCVPRVSSVEWHPLSVASCPGRASQLGEVRFIAKQTGGPRSWTHRLGAAAETAAGDGEPLTVKLEGPYGGVPLPLHRAYRVVVLAAGGSGITPMACVALGLLRDAAACRAEHVSLAWVLRADDAADLAATWLPELAQLAACARFRMQLFNTAGRPTAAHGTAADECARVYAKRDANAEVRFDISAPTGRGDAVGAARQALQTAVRVGRPDWAEVILAASRKVDPPAAPSQVAVLVCGPDTMVAAVRQAALHARCHLHSETFTL